MRRHALLACLTMALAVPAFATVAHADDAAVIDAKTRFEEGLELADAGKHEPARVKFLQAWSVFKSPAVLYNLARSEQLTGHDLEALEHFKLFVKVGAADAKITDTMREKAKQNAAELARKLGQIDIEVPPTARVALDGKTLEETPNEPVAVQPGRHTIEVSFDGRVKSITVECTAGNVVKAKIEFESGAVTPPPREHARSSPARWIVPTILGVAGLAAFGVGMGLGASSQSAKTDSEKIRRDNPGLCAQPATSMCAAYDSKRDDAESASTISTVGYVAGGALVVAAVFALVLWPKTKERTATAPARGISAEGVRPLIGGGTLGAGFEGHF